MLEDVDVQKRGFVLVPYLLDGLNVKQRNASSTLAGMLNHIPIRSASVHVLYNQPMLRPMFSLMLGGLAAHHRIRVRGHFGTCRL